MTLQALIIDNYSSSKFNREPPICGNNYMKGGRQCTEFERKTKAVQDTVKTGNTKPYQTVLKLHLLLKKKKKKVGEHLQKCQLKRDLK